MGYVLFLFIVVMNVGNCKYGKNGIEKVYESLRI